MKGEGAGYKGKGKGYKGGKGKGFKGAYRSQGKAIGKGLKYYSNDDYVEAWGDERYNYDCEYNDGDWGYDTYSDGYVGKLTMMLERGTEETANELGVTRRDVEGLCAICIEQFGTREVLTGRAMAKRVKVLNSFEALGDGDGDDGGDSTNTASQFVQKKEVNHNKRQRAKRRFMISGRRSCSDWGDEAIRDAAAADRVRESNWVAIGTKQCSKQLAKRRNNNDTTTTTTNSQDGKNVMNEQLTKTIESTKVVPPPRRNNHWVKSLVRRTVDYSSRLRIVTRSSVVLATDLSCERVRPHKWQADGDEVMGLETLHEESPMPELHGHDGQRKAPPLVSRAQRVSREVHCTRSTCHLAAPSTGTCPSGYIPGTRGLQCTTLPTKG